MSMIRTAFARQARLFSTSPIVRKTIAENVQDAAKAVDRTVADAAVKGIETGGKLASPPIDTYFGTKQTLTPLNRASD